MRLLDCKYLEEIEGLREGWLGFGPFGVRFLKASERLFSSLSTHSSSPWALPFLPRQNIWNQVVSVHKSLTSRSQCNSNESLPSSFFSVLADFFTSPTPLPSDYIVRSETPSVETYCALRSKSGLSPFTPESATVGLKNSTYSCVIVHQPSDSVIGMGRVVGDGGCFIIICDIAVLPEHQKKGLGKILIETLLKWCQKNINEGAFVSLFADGPAKQLYQRYGFRETGPYSLGMGLIIWDRQTRWEQWRSQFESVLSLELVLTGS